VADDRLLFEGPLGRLSADDVLQLAQGLDGAVELSFETADRASGQLRAVDLGLERGRLVHLGPRGKGLRLGDLAVARAVVARRRLEALAAGEGPPLGERLVAAGLCDAATVEDLLWERHARVIWSLGAWQGGSFRVCARAAAAPPAGAVAVEPPLPLSALLLDGLQRAESARS
jgi:hypothetical protein